MVIAGTLPPIRSLFLVPTQIIAAMCAAGLVQAMFPGDITLTNTTLSPGTSIAQGVFIEMFMTAELVFVVLMLAAEKSKDTFLAPIGIGLALFVAMMGGSFDEIFVVNDALWLTIDRRILHRWLAQSGSKLRTGCRRYSIPRLPLDILDRSTIGCSHRCWVLQVREILQLRGGESRTGCVQYRSAGVRR
jgi:glycerol uptake facilitator-like aquaporin